MILIINQKKKKKNLVHPTTFEVVSNGNGPLGTHILSHTIAFSLSISLSLYPLHIFISVHDPFILVPYSVNVGPLEMGLG